MILSGLSSNGGNTLSNVYDSRSLAYLDGFGSLISTILYFISAINLRKLQAKGATFYGYAIICNVLLSISYLFMLDINPEQFGYFFGQTIAGYIIPGLILWFLNSKKAKFVCTSTYRDEIIAATPDIKYKSPWMILLVLLILIIALIAIAAL
ncbi:MAG: hypothetical protein HRU15_05220 [Planctomycetes bacterium]|nr:hypothetical protein [Planctomycetota bacterium]